MSLPRHETDSPASSDERPAVLAYWATHSTLNSAVGYADGRSLHTTGKVGFLVYGPYASLPAGHYVINLDGSLRVAGGAWMDLVCDKGTTVLIKPIPFLKNKEQNQRLIDFDFTLNHFVSDLELRIFVKEDTDMIFNGLALYEKLESAFINTLTLN